MRNHSIDVLKFYCSLLVVFLHVWTPYYSLYGYFTRCAVPCFFMISGYFMNRNTSQRDAIFRGIYKMIILIIESTLIYIPFFIYDSYTTCQYPPLSYNSWINFFLYNENPFGFHLWYLSAYLYVLLVWLLLLDKIKSKVWKASIVSVIIILFLGAFVIDVLSAKNILICPSFYFRNWFFMGLPCFGVGYFIKEIERLEKIGLQSCLVAAFFLYAVFLSCEVVILGNHFSSNSDIHLSAYFLALVLFLFCLRFKSCKETIFSRIGHKYTLYIYIIHFGLINLVQSCLSVLPLKMERGYAYLSPFLVYLLALGFAVIYDRMKNGQVIGVSK